MLKSASFAILEQITPVGSSHPFATTMIAHFNKLNTPLLSLPQYPTLRSQARRFLEAGYADIETCDLNTFFYSGVMAQEDHINALKVELFDEYEELGAFLGHYFLLVARNDVSKQWLRPQNQDWQYINWKRDMLLNGNMAASSQLHESQSANENLVVTVLDHKPIRRRFPAVAACENGFLIQGGLSTTTRLSTSLHLRPTTESSIFEVHSTNTSGARMCHTMTTLNTGILLIGGRDAPNSGTAECQYYEMRDGRGRWDTETQVPLGKGKQGIYRHTVTAIGQEQVVLFGGRRECGIPSDDWLRYDRCKGWDKLECHDTCPALWGASICWKDGVGVLLGGMTSDGECTGDVYTWRLEGNTVVLKRWDLDRQSRSLTRRYGAKLVPYGDGEFLVVGGAGSHRVLTWSEQFLLLSPATESIRAVDIPKVAEVDPWLVGHDIALHEITRDIVIVGGGGVCFSFGSFWNENVLHLSYLYSTSSTKFWQLLEESFVNPRTNQLPPMEGTSSKQIRRIRVTTPEQWHNQVLQKSEVCILEGLHFGNCINKWTPEYLKSSVGEKPVVIHSTNAHAMNFLQKNFKYATQSFAAFIDTVFSDDDEKVYLRAVSDDPKNKPARLEDDFPSLATDFEIPTILRGEGGIEDKVFSTVLRIGGVGTSMWLHYDVLHPRVLRLILGYGQYPHPNRR
jgi:tRNA wybutosine-synthesizing protein 4